jgi:hypothetical protein
VRDGSLNYDESSCFYCQSFVSDEFWTNYFGLNPCIASLCSLRVLLGGWEASEERTAEIPRGLAAAEFSLYGGARCWSLLRNDGFY